jgi:tetratricopeptide repeat protein
MRLLLPSIALTAVLAAGSANADSSVTRASAGRWFRQGETAFARRDFGAAALAFEKAARLAPHPAAWLNAAEAWARAGNLVLAGTDCDEVLAMQNVPSRPREEAARRLAWIESRLSRLDLRSASPLAVAIDKAPPVDLPQTIRVVPGKHQLTVIEPVDHRTTEIDVVLLAGQVIVLDLPLREGAQANGVAPGLEGASRSAEKENENHENHENNETPAVDAAAAHRDVELSLPPPTAESHSFDQPLLPLPEARSGPPLSATLAFAASGVAIAVASVFGGLTLSAKSAYDEAPSQERADRFFARRLTTNVALVSAAVAAGTGALLWVIDDSSE